MYNETLLKVSSYLTMDIIRMTMYENINIPVMF